MYIPASGEYVPGEKELDGLILYSLIGWTSGPPQGFEGLEIPQRRCSRYALTQFADPIYAVRPVFRGVRSDQSNGAEQLHGVLVST